MKVKIFEKYSIRLEPINNKIEVKVNALINERSPVTKGLVLVRSIFLSVSLSNIWLRAADAAAKRAKPTKLARPLITLI